MKKTLIALAALAATGAFAQSTVTIYGQVDAAYTNASSEGVSKSTISDSQMGSSLIGFKGTEDLGGGLKANFKLEGGLANDSGAGKATNTNNQASGALTTQTGLTFQRYAYVGLSGNFGEVRLGRDYVSAFQGGSGAVDPFGTNGPASANNMMFKLGAVSGATTSASASNMIEYTTPSMGGFSANLQLFQGENTSGAANSDDGNGYSAQAQYAKGPVFVSIAQQVTKYAAAGDYTLRALSAAYDFGMAKAVYTYAHEGVAAVAAGTNDAKNDSNLIGVIVPFGAANFKASYIRSVKNLGAGADTSGTQVGLGVDYAMSKRTTLYTTYGRVTNSDNAAANATATYSTGVVSTTAVNPTSSMVAIGIKHSF